eukprot:1973300-Prymnesium_polylepis.1
MVQLSPDQSVVLVGASRSGRERRRAARALVCALGLGQQVLATSVRSPPPDLAAQASPRGRAHANHRGDEFVCSCVVFFKLRAIASPSQGVV